MNAQVCGDVAIVQASVTEKRIHDGKDISGQFVFMDLLKKRDGELRRQRVPTSDTKARKRN